MHRHIGDVLFSDDGRKRAGKGVDKKLSDDKSRGMRTRDYFMTIHPNCSPSPQLWLTEYEEFLRAKLGRSTLLLSISRHAAQTNRARHNKLGKIFADQRFTFASQNPDSRPKADRIRVLVTELNSAAAKTGIKQWRDRALALPPVMTR